MDTAILEKFVNRIDARNLVGALIATNESLLKYIDEKVAEKYDGMPLAKVKDMFEQLNTALQVVSEKLKDAEKLWKENNFEDVKGDVECLIKTVDIQLEQYTKQANKMVEKIDICDMLGALEAIKDILLKTREKM